MIFWQSIIYFLGLISICSCFTYEDFIQMKIRGEYRKACSKYGAPPQPPSRVTTKEKLKQLRKIMLNETITKGIALGAYIINSNDEHQTEYVAEYDRRREYISGFSGSYGDAIVTQDKAILWTDGRYHLQADDQLECEWLLMRLGHANVMTPSQWLRKEFPNGTNVGVDPKLISQSSWSELTYELKGSKIKLVAIENNLIDVMWKENRPPKRNKDVFVLEKRYSGKIWTEKIDEVRELLNQSQADGMIITALDEIAWLLNIRGRDIPYNPFVRSYVIVDTHNIKFFVNESQLYKHNIFKYFNETKSETKYQVRVLPYDDVCDSVKILSQAYQKVLIPSRCANSPGASHFINECVPKGKRLHQHSPIIFLKAQKNPTEVKGMQQAHIRDAAAICECFAYLESRAGTSFTEFDIVKILNDFRFEQEFSLGNSFRTIAAFGPNGAQPHYEPTPNTNIRIFDNSTLVLDSGGQYYDGTTDVTRTLHFGSPSEDQKQAYTRVLIGQIQTSSLTFPDNMRTAVADVLSRAPLWEVGLDYLHGTSHGVGSFLGVHESPIGMHFEEMSGFPETEILKPGYFLSNEPGFYRENDFGVRLENVLEVVNKPWLKHASGHAFLGFRVVTLVPYERKLMDLTLLSVQQRRWLNSYNARIRSYVGAELKRQNLMSGFYWMMENTASIPEYGHGNIPTSQSFLILSLAIFVALFNYHN